MSFTNKTTHYGLPQWIGTDKPTYLIDQNNAYKEIDNQIYLANETAGNAEDVANLADGKADNALNTATEAVKSAVEAQTSANQATVVANNANQQAGAAIITANAASQTANEAKQMIGDIDQWYEYFVNLNASNTHPTLAAKIVSTDFSHLHLFYNKRLSLLVFGAYSDLVAGTTSIQFTSSFVVALRNNKGGTSNRNFYPMIKLPFKYATSIAPDIYNNALSGRYITTEGYSVPTGMSGTIIKDNVGDVWWGGLTSSNTLTWYSNVLIIPMNNFMYMGRYGELNLDSWTPISTPTALLENIPSFTDN